MKFKSKGLPIQIFAIVGKPGNKDALLKIAQKHGAENVGDSSNMTPEMQNLLAGAAPQPDM